jgi:hypothetical protein
MNRAWSGRVLARRIRFLRRENIMHGINVAAATPRAPMLQWLLMADILPNYDSLL